MFLGDHITGPQIFHKLPAFYELKVHDRVNNSPPLVSIINKINTLHAFIFSIIKLLKTKSNLLYIRNQPVPRSKHFISVIKIN